MFINSHNGDLIIRSRVKPPLWEYINKSWKLFEVYVWDGSEQEIWKFCWDFTNVISGGNWLFRWDCVFSGGIFCPSASYATKIFFSNSTKFMLISQNITTCSRLLDTWLILLHRSFFPIITIFQSKVESVLYTFIMHCLFCVSLSRFSNIFQNISRCPLLQFGFVKTKNIRIKTL